MALPKLDVPIYELNLPSDGKTITYRPFLVKEEKILLMAMEGEDEKEITTAIKQIINNCIVSPDIDVDKLPLFDIEYISHNRLDYYYPIIKYHLILYQIIYYIIL